MNIGIIGAMDKEIKNFIEMYDLKKVEEDIYIGVYNTNKIVLVKSGIGKVNAAIMTQYIIDKYSIDYIINSGCAGSLTDKVNIMDIIIASNVGYHDFTPIRIMEESTPDNGNIKTDKKLFDLTIDSVNELNYNYVVGSITSGDMFVTSSEMRDSIYSRTNALAVDMESGSIGHTCRKNNIPFIIIRTISDFADGVEEREEEAADKSSLLVEQIIKKLNN